MTTIAADPAIGCMVADSQVADGDQKWSANKIERTESGLYGAAGDSANCEKFFEYVRKGCKGRRPKVSEDFAALALTRKGLFLYDQHMHPMRMDQSFSVGSGGKCARSAMMAGADIVRAVEIACLVDAGSSLPILVFRLDEERAR